MVHLAIAAALSVAAVVWPVASSGARTSALMPHRTAARTGRGHVALTTLPARVYKVKDAIDTQEPSEGWYFRLVVADSTRQLTPRAATIGLYAGDTRVSSLALGREALAAIRGLTFRRHGIDECLDLVHHFREPTALAIDRLHYDLELTGPSGATFHESLDVPLGEYRQKSRLIFPVRGNFVVVNGTALEGGHHERSQMFAYDIVGLGPLDEWLAHGDGSKNDDFAGWGREVVAPAAGTVTYSRNDVPDNTAPGASDLKALAALPDPETAVAGNAIVIDHGNGEFSFLAHMQQGSVRVKRGDRVEQGQIVGWLGNSGHAQGPHLHYHLMDGPLLYRADGLPSRFENLEGGAPVQGVPSAAK